MHDSEYFFDFMLRDTRVLTHGTLVDDANFHGPRRRKAAVTQSAEKQNTTMSTQTAGKRKRTDTLRGSREQNMNGLKTKNNKKKNGWDVHEYCKTCLCFFPAKNLDGRRTHTASTTAAPVYAAQSRSSFIWQQQYEYIFEIKGSGQGLTTISDAVYPWFFFIRSNTTNFT